MRSRAEAPERLSSTLTSRLASRRTSATSRIDRPEAVLRVRFMPRQFAARAFRALWPSVQSWVRALVRRSRVCPCETWEAVAEAEMTARAPDRPSDSLRRPVPGPLFPIVKVASWVELGLFAILLVVWLAPGLEHETFYAGLAHGVGFIALALLIWIAVLRREAPYTLLAATLTPVGPVGSVIAIEVLERRET
jgi:hypothetical protein